jgi:uncharacterized membrane protein YdbT with pleckstrin-like domain
MEWKDRKRILGMPLSFTRYRLDSNRLFVSRGLFTTVEDELVIYRVLDVRLQRTFGDKIFGVGTVILYTADETHKELKLERIKKSKTVRDMISEIAENERARLGIKGRELYGVAENYSDEDADDDQGNN